MYGLTEKNCQNLTQSQQAKGTYRCDGYWEEKNRRKIQKAAQILIEKLENIILTNRVITIEQRKIMMEKKSKITKGGGNLL